MTAPLTVHVPLGARAYDILIGEGLLEGAGERLAALFPGRRFGIVTDTEVEKAQLPTLLRSLDAAGLSHANLVVPHGEASKSIARLNEVVEGLLAARLERGDIVLALGGGVIGDLAGFAAAVTRRGMDFVQLPTSLLAQVDSSVGGKTGVNAPQGKNLIGAFTSRAWCSPTSRRSRRCRRGSSPPARRGGEIRADRRRGFLLLARGQPPRDLRGRPRPRRGGGPVLRGQDPLRPRRREGDRCPGAAQPGTPSGTRWKRRRFSDRLLHGEASPSAWCWRMPSRRGWGWRRARTPAASPPISRPPACPPAGADPGELPGTDFLMDAIAQDKKVVRGALTFILTRGIGKAFIERDVSPRRSRRSSRR